MNRKAPWYRAQPKAAKPGRRRIRSVSRVRAKALREYAKARAVWWAKSFNRFCRFPGCQRRATELHHSHGRLGPLLTDERFWVPVCAEHHRRIGEKPAEARMLGLLAELGDWNRTR